MTRPPASLEKGWGYQSGIATKAGQNSSMLVSDFDYALPDRLIAQEPSPRRDHSRLLVLDRASGTFRDRVFNDLPQLLAGGDLLVLNNTRVFPARLIGRRVRTTTHGKSVLGGRVEVFLVRRIGSLVWEALVRPGRSLLPGTRVEFARGKLLAEVVEWMEGGRRVVRFEFGGRHARAESGKTGEASQDLDGLIDRIGRTPLPPYIKRDEEDRLDAERYQTVFALERGAVAAPTAGLHFTRELIDRLRSRGVEVAEITLHVGYGTFKPVKVERVEEHRLEPEAYVISADAAERINQALSAGRRVVAVGTTTTRALESAARGRRVDAMRDPRSTDLFIYPGFKFQVVKGLITNFHLPRSSLLMLVAAFAGRELILEAYGHAIASEYRFYSYGDAMLIM